MKFAILSSVSLTAAVLSLGAATVPKPEPPQRLSTRILGTFGDIPAPESGARTVEGWGTSGERLLPIRFADGPTAPSKVTYDFAIRGDLERRGPLSLDVFVPDLRLATVNMYLRSGAGGWYRCFYRLPDSAVGRWVRMELSRTLFTGVEGNPLGWDRIDGFRISFSRPLGCGVFSSFVALANMTEPLVSEGAPLVILSPTKDGRHFGNVVADTIRDMGLSVTTLDEGAVDADSLVRCPFVVLPYNPSLSPAAYAAFKAYLDAGGHAIVSACGLGKEALSAMGVKSVGSWFAKRETGNFRIGGLLPKGHLAANGLTGLVEQVSWQTEKLAPVGDGEVVATWADAFGADSAMPAAVQTERGFTFGHVFLKTGAPLLREMVYSLCPNVRARAVARVAELERFEEAANAWAKSLPGKSGERRLMWCHSPLGLHKDGDWETSVRELKECGYTDLIANLAWGYGADYPSRVMPSTPIVARHGDMLEAAKTACRRHGVRLHVWLVCWPMARGIDKSYAASLDRQGRLQRNAKGALVRTNNTTWLCPSSPENRTLLGNAMLEMAEKGADGVHFDYIRYPGESACYCQDCRRRFEANLKRPCADWPKAVMAGGLDRAEWVKFRIENVTALVKTVGDAVHARYPGVEVSAAVFRDPRGDAVSVGQDWADWLKSGYVDFVCPMDYTWSESGFRAYLRHQKSEVGTAKVFPGIGLTSSARFPLDGGDAYRFSEQVLAVREEGFPGFTCFNFDGRCVKAMRIAREGVLRP